MILPRLSAVVRMKNSIEIKVTNVAFPCYWESSPDDRMALLLGFSPVTFIRTPVSGAQPLPWDLSRALILADGHLLVQQTATLYLSGPRSPPALGGLAVWGQHGVGGGSTDQPVTWLQTQNTGPGATVTVAQVLQGWQTHPVGSPSL